MLAQQHNIKNFVLNLELDRTRQEAYIVKDEILELISSEVQPILDQMLSKKVDASTTLKIENLQINVDPIAWKNWKQQFVKQCLEKIKTELDIVVPQAIEKGGQSLSLSQASVRSVFDSTERFYFDQVERIRIRFFHFLQYGHFPWWGKPSDWAEWEAEVLQVVIRKYPTRFFYTLKAFLGRWPRSIDRLHTQYSKAFIVSFLQCYQSSNKALELKSHAINSNSSSSELQQVLALLFLEEIKNLSSWQSFITAAKAQLKSRELADLQPEAASPQNEPSSSDATLERLQDDETTKAMTDGRSEEEIPLVQEKGLDTSSEIADKKWSKETNKIEIDENSGNTQESESASSSELAREPNKETREPGVDPSTSLPEGMATKEESSSDTLEKGKALVNDASQAGEELQPTKQKSAEANQSTEQSIAGTDQSDIQIPSDRQEEQFLAEADHFLDSALVYRSSQELDAAFIQNAGLALVIPCLYPIFSALGYLNEKGGFINKHAQWRAATLLQFMVTGETNPAEYEMTLNKIACGLRLSEPIERILDLSPQEKDLGIELLTTLIGHVKKLKNTSVAGLRHNFLLRKGKISFEKNHWLLRVEKASYDPFLLDNLPWSMGMIRFRWMPKRLLVEWL